MVSAPLLSSADHALIHAVGWLSANLSADHRHLKSTCSIAADVLPKANRTIAIVNEFAKAAEDILAALEAGNGPAHARAMWDAKLALQKWHADRLARAWEVFQSATREDA